MRKTLSFQKKRAKLEGIAVLLGYDALAGKTETPLLFKFFGAVETDSKMAVDVWVGAESIKAQFDASKVLFKKKFIQGGSKYQSVILYNPNAYTDMPKKSEFKYHSKFCKQIFFADTAIKESFDNKVKDIFEALFNQGKGGLK